MKRVILVLISFLLIFGFCLFLLTKPYYDFYKNITSIPLLNFVTNEDLPNVTSQINFVLLGIGGGSHEGPDLTDSIQVANLDLQNARVRILGIPRDIWIESSKDKINTLYTYAEKKSPGSGLNSMQDTLQKLTGTNITFTAVINFDHFSELIDTLGGIDVVVANSFIDDHYPIKGKENDTCGGDTSYKCRYKTLSFTAGKNHFDGETALAFVRSRYSTSDEGNDFARLQRQQSVIEAIIEKLKKHLSNPTVSKLRNIYAVLDKAVVRNIENDKLMSVFRKLLVKMGNIKIEKTSYPVDYFYFPPLTSIKYNRKYVLLPKNDDFDSLATISACLLTGTGNNCY